MDADALRRRRRRDPPRRAGRAGGAPAALRGARGLDARALRRRRLDRRRRGRTARGQALRDRPRRGVRLRGGGRRGRRPPQRAIRVTALPADLAASFRGRRVLITGGLGFIGSNLAHALVAAGSDVTIVDSLMPSHGGSWANVEGIESELEVHELDVRDTARLHEHLDGQGRPLQPRRPDEPPRLDDATRAPTSGSTARRSSPCSRRAGSTTPSCGSSSPARGRSTVGRATSRSTSGTRSSPVDVNGINKTAGEWYHLLYGRVYGLPVTVLRLTNTYGPRMRVRDARQTFLGLWIRQALADEELLVFGDGTPAARLRLRRRRRARALSRGDVAGGARRGVQRRRRTGT